MSNGRLKASTNRVRTSVALQQTSIWTTAIGVEKFEPVNSVIEATLNAPGVAGGGRRAKQQAAAQAVAAAGGAGGQVDDYKGLIDLARAQGALGGLNRGACKKCGQLGHLTKQCRNQFSRFFDGGPDAATTAAAAAAAGVPTAALSMAPMAEGDGAPGGPSDSDSMGSLVDTDTDSSSSSSSDSEAERRRHKEKKRKQRQKEKAKEHKHKSRKSVKKRKAPKEKRAHSKNKRNHSHRSSD